VSQLSWVAWSSASVRIASSRHRSANGSADRVPRPWPRRPSTSDLVAAVRHQGDMALLGCDLLRGCGSEGRAEILRRRAPADYVLFASPSRIRQPHRLTFYAGMFADWDIDDDFVDDVGATDLDGRLMYVTNEGGGVAAGSLILSDAPASGNAFLGPFGTRRTPSSARWPGLFQSLGRHPGRSALRPCRGANHACRGRADRRVDCHCRRGRSVQLLRNAAAAAADVANRRTAATRRRPWRRRARRPRP